MKWVQWAGRVMQARASCLSILIFHRVLERPDALFPEEPDALRFETLLRQVACGFQVLPLAKAVAALDEGRLPRNALAITFDDGYADNQQVAAPILQRLGLHATFFVATGFLDGGRMWNDTVVEALRRTRLQRLDLTDLGLGVHLLETTTQRRRAINDLLPQVKYLPPADRLRQVDAIASACGEALPTNLMMSTAQLQALHRSGMGIGGHTVQHPILCSVPDEQARQEIVTNKQQLEATLQAPMGLFAYPNGKPDTDFAARHAHMVREAGYRAAVTTAPGAGRQGDDLMQLPRFTPWDRDAWRFSMRMVINARQAGRVAA